MSKQKGARGKYVKGQGVLMTLPNGDIVSAQELLAMKKAKQGTEIRKFIAPGTAQVMIESVEEISPAVEETKEVEKSTPWATIDRSEIKPMRERKVRASWFEKLFKRK